jgi:hypothetical protein
MRRWRRTRWRIPQWRWRQWQRWPWCSAFRRRLSTPMSNFRILDHSHHAARARPPSVQSVESPKTHDWRLTVARWNILRSGSSLSLFARWPVVSFFSHAMARGGGEVRLYSHAEDLGPVNELRISRLSSLWFVFSVLLRLLWWWRRLTRWPHHVARRVIAFAYRRSRGS